MGAEDSSFDVSSSGRDVVCTNASCDCNRCGRVEVQRYERDCRL